MRPPSSIILRRQDPFIKKLVELRDEKNSALLLLEGPRLLKEALQSHLVIQTLVICQHEGQNALPQEAALIETARAQAKETIFVNESVFRVISDVEEPQGVAAFCDRPRWSWNDLLDRKPRPLIILDGLQNPGNVAAICRTAEAADAAGVITTSGTAHLFSPKSIRGGMGSTFRLPSLEHRTFGDIAVKLHAAGYQLLGAAVSQTSFPYTKVNWKQPWAIVLGQEGAGLRKDWQSHLHHMVAIPMAAPVDSLNVAASAAVLLYESHRQRNS